MSHAPDKRFDYRMGWLAGPQDVVVIGGPDCPAFEAYQRTVTGSVGLTYLNVDPANAMPRRATTAICLRDVNSFERLEGVVAGRMGTTLHAHLTTGTIWALASRLAQKIRTKVFVAGPPPLLSRRCNDKLWFGGVVKRLLGAGATPPKRAAFSAAALTRQVADLAKKWDRIVVKVPDSAGSAGNFVIHAHDVRDIGARALFKRLRDALPKNGRAPRFPMLVEVWDANVLTSPSVQTWIPSPEDGPPIIEGVFEQILSGETAAFAGAAEADLPRHIDDSLSTGAMELAMVLQRLGYFGRCSFDALVTGANSHVGAIHWIECNARWGGVSVPMSLVNRLAGADRAPPFVIVQNDSDPFRPFPFAAAVQEFSNLAPAPDLRSGVLFLSPNLMEAGTGCHFLSFGTDAKAAERQAKAALHRLSCSERCTAPTRART
ncbi:MAG: hypothetical protein QNJ44_17880 [Rhodobacter sp.]|nr:hypothetical protein [Rhodobacter sp.]